MSPHDECHCHRPSICSLFSLVINIIIISDVAPGVCVAVGECCKNASAAVNVSASSTAVLLRLNADRARLCRLMLSQVPQLR